MSDATLFDTPTQSSLEMVPVPPVVEGGILALAAAKLGWNNQQFVDMLMTQPLIIPAEDKAGNAIQFKSIPPHSVAGTYGPRPADVLIVGKAPNVEELDDVRLFSRIRGKMWKDLLDQMGINYSSWVLTNACWWWTDGNKLPAAHFKEFEHLLARTINTVRPKHILCFGADAMKAVWGLHDPLMAKGLTFKNARGAVMDYAGGAKLMVGVHPANVLANPATTDDFVQDVRSFGRLVSGRQASSVKYTILELEHEAQLKELVDRLIAEGKTRFSIDCEGVLGGQLRTMQFAWSATEGAIVILRRQGMKPAFLPSMHSAIPHLIRLFCRPGVTVVGHNIRGDIQWLLNYGLDLTEQFINGGFDTMLGYHELAELDDKQLEVVALKLLGTPRYDLELRKWLSDNGYKKEDLKEVGYGDVPDDLLHPYAVMDAIVTWALAEVLVPEIKKWPGLWDHYITNVHNTNLPLMEMESNGVMIDVDRVRRMAELTASRLETLTGKLRHKFNWPDFNPGSPQQVAELMFGFVPMKDGVPQPKAPPQALCFRLKPIKSTDKPKKSIPWERVERKPPAEQAKYSPSTDQESVRILAADCPALNEFSQWKTVDQLRKNFLRQEEEDTASGEMEWTKGIGSWISEDGRLRTKFRQTLETGRYATSPNLQNWPKKTEKDIRKCFLVNQWVVYRRLDVGVEYYDGVGWVRNFQPDGTFNQGIKPLVFTREAEARDTAAMYSADVEQLVDPRYFPLRSVMIASPGMVLVEPDWNQAELWTLGACAHDDEFLHVLGDKNNDLHTLMMQKMFTSINYHGKPLGGYTIPELNKLRKKDKYLEALRTCAKTVNFGETTL